VTNGSFSENAAAGGGAITIFVGNTRIHNSIFRSNQGRYGAALYSTGGTATLTNTTFSENRGPFGPGLYVDGGSVQVVDGVISRCVTEVLGIVFIVNGAVIVNRTLFSQNLGASLATQGGVTQVYGAVFDSNAGTDGGAGLSQLSSFFTI
jgi:hypothetical protein